MNCFQDTYGVNMDGKEVLLLRSLFWPSVSQRNYLQVSRKLASLLLRWLRSGWASPPALMCSFMWLITASRGVGPSAPKQLKTIPFCSTQSRPFSFSFFNLFLDSHHMEAFCELVLHASWNYAGTPAPTTGPTLMSVGNGPSRAVCCLIPPPLSFLSPWNRVAFTTRFCKTIRLLRFVLASKLPLLEETWCLPS